MIYMIVASTEKGVIGDNNKLPWKIKAELEYFKETTKYSTLLMGYNTYKSLPGKLPNREIIVLTRKDLDDVETIKISEIQLLFASFAESENVLFIAGGKQLYESFYKKATKIYHSFIKKEYKGDTIIKLDYSDYDLGKTINQKEFIVKIYNKKK